jgi:hypothetical protein
MDPLTPQHEVDLLSVVGSGNGGLTAVLCAYELGIKSVLVIEKSDQYGGTSATSGGVIWIPCSRYALESGARDSYKSALMSGAEIRAQCGSSACWDLCGRAVGTATCQSSLPGRCYLPCDSSSVMLAAVGTEQIPQGHFCALRRKVAGPRRANRAPKIAG